MCPFSGSDTGRECMAQVRDLAAVSCPEAGKIII